MPRQSVNRLVVGIPTRAFYAALFTFMICGHAIAQWAPETVHNHDSSTMPWDPVTGVITPPSQPWANGGILLTGTDGGASGAQNDPNDIGGSFPFPDIYGNSVKLVGDYLFVLAPAETSAEARASGSVGGGALYVYRYRQPEGDWVVVQKLVTGGGESWNPVPSFLNLGPIAADSHDLLVGNFVAIHNGNKDDDGVFAYTLSGGSTPIWQFKQKIRRPSVPSAQQHPTIGTRVSVDGDHAIVAYNHEDVFINNGVPHPFDLANKSLRFKRVGANYTVTAIPNAIVSDLGDDLGTFGVVPLNMPFAFPFFDSNQTDIFIGRSGFIDFGACCGYFVGSGPRLSALYTPLRNGKVYANTSLQDSVIITWQSIENGEPPEGVNTFQVILQRNGEIDLNYGSVTAVDVIVGLSSGDHANAASVDLSAAPASYAQNTFYEYFHDGKISGTGRIYTFKKAAVTDAWTYVDVHTAPFEHIIANFGSGIALEGTHAVVTGSGVAYPFEFANGSWNWNGQVLSWADNPEGIYETNVPLFAATPAINGNTLVIGTIGVLNGRVQLYRLTGNQWSFVQALKPTSPQAGECFGSSVALSRNYLAVSAPCYSTPGVRYAGAVYVFKRGSSGWEEDGLLQNPNPQAGVRDGFGGFLAGVSVSQDHIAIGTGMASARISAGPYYKPDAGWATIYGPGPVIAQVRRPNLAASSSKGVFREVRYSDPFEATNNHGLERPTQADQLSGVTRPTSFPAITNFDYSLSSASQVFLEVFDMKTGQKVATLVDGAQNAGPHGLSLSSTGLRPGTYVFRLTTSNGVVSRTIVTG